MNKPSDAARGSLGLVPGAASPPQRVAPTWSWTSGARVVGSGAAPLGPGHGRSRTAAPLHLAPPTATDAPGPTRTPGRWWTPGHSPVSLADLPLVPMALLLSAAASAVLFLLGPPLPAPTDTGLVSVLPPSYWATVALLLTGITVSVWGRRLSHGLAAAHVSLLVVTLYGVAATSSAYPRGTVSWRHVGVATELASTRVVDAGIDAYFGWPGFFSLVASFTGLAGVDDAEPVMTWAPVLNELLLLLPLLVVLRALSSDDRIVWSAVTLFYLTNWVDQDYLSPQALSYFLYLSVLGLLLTFFRPAAPRTSRARVGQLARAWAAVPRALRGAGPEADPAGPGPAPAPASARPVVVLVVVTVTTAVVLVHQLTPFALLLAFVALAVARRTTVQGLPLLTVVLILFWFTYGASVYLQGNLGTLLAGVGDFAEAARGGLVERIQGSPGHVLVVRGRLLFSLAVWSAAALAVLLHYRRGQRDTSAVLLLVSPALLFGLQSYGGEMLLRIFMFSLPFACLLALQLLPRSRTSTGRRVCGAALLATALVLTPAFVLVRYGNQLTDQRAPGEVRAVEELYRLAPPGTLLVAGNDNTPWRYTEYGQHRHVTLERLLEVKAPADASQAQDALEAELGTYPQGAFLLLTRQQENFERLFGVRTPYTVREMREALTRSDDFAVVFRNDDAVILQLRPGNR